VHHHHHHLHHHHKHQGLDPLIRSVSRVTTALANVSSVFQLFPFLVVCSDMISKGFGLVAFFASVKASSVYISFKLLTKIIYSSRVSPTHVKCLVHILLLDFILHNNIRWGVQIMKHLIIQPTPFFYSAVCCSGLCSKRRQYLFFALTYTICSTRLPPPCLLQS
jgi:hypothetical protein